MQNFVIPKNENIFVGIGHPDDDWYFATLIRKMASAGCRIKVVSLTQGEKGIGNLAPELHSQVAQIRAREFAESCKALRVTGKILEFPDGGLVNHPAQPIIKSIAHEIETFGPTDKFVGFDRFGMSGHTDHQEAHNLFVAAAKEVAPTVPFFGVTIPDKFLEPGLRVLHARRKTKRSYVDWPENPPTMNEVFGIDFNRPIKSQVADKYDSQQLRQTSDDFCAIPGMQEFYVRLR